MKFKKRGVVNCLIPSSKSQVAIFIVMALVILLVGLLYFFYQRISLEEEVDVVPAEVSPVKLFVEQQIAERKYTIAQLLDIVENKFGGRKDKS